MSLFDLIAVLVSLAAVFSYLNHRFLGLPTTIGLMLISLLMSVCLVVAGNWVPNAHHQAGELLQRVDFDATLLHGLLGFLLFAGALHVNLNDLAKQRWLIGTLATGGVLVSTFVVGYLTWWMLSWLDLELPLIYCLLFGALISPTDPIAVLGILKQAGAPKSLETKITGESLFNDGIGVVVFLVLLGLATGEQSLDWSSVAELFLHEALGGLLFGLGAGLLTFWMLQSVDDYHVEVLLSLALVTGGYALAEALHVSAPIAIVVAGLLIGNHGRRLAMSPTTLENLDRFWELIDEILNAVLFVLIGLEVLALTFELRYLAAGLLAIPLVLLARLVAVGLPVHVLLRWRQFTPGAVRVLTWGGLRGGISVALALSLPAGPERDVILTITYIVVVFSILVQGLSIGRVVRAVCAKDTAGESRSDT